MQLHATSVPLTLSLAFAASSARMSFSDLPDLAASTASLGLAAPKGFCRARRDSRRETQLTLT